MGLMDDGPLAFFNQIYKNSIPRGYEVTDKIEFMEVLQTLERYGMPTTLFIENLKTLAMVEVGKELGVDAVYLPKYNKIEYTDWKFVRHELYHVASSKEDGSSGITIRHGDEYVGVALKEGITELFESLGSDEATSHYPFEKLCALSLATIYGMDIFKPHFEADPRAFLAGFGDDADDIYELMVELDCYKESLEAVAESMERGIIDPDAHERTILFFNKCVGDLRGLYASKHKGEPLSTRYEVIDRLLQNGFKEPEMKDVINIVTRYSGEDYKPAGIKK